MAITNLSYKTAADVVKSEPRLHAGRDDATLAAGSGVCTVGTVLGRNTSTGAYSPFAPGASDGTETASAVLLQYADATDEAVTVVVLARGTAEVVSQGLVWPGGATAAQQATGLAALETKLITARNGV